MAEEEFLLHIGTHKTGTTSVQHFLGDNQTALLARGVEILADRGVDVPGRIHRFNISSIAHHFMRQNLVTDARARSLVPNENDVDRDEFEDRLVDRINISPCSKVVGSAEAFCFFRSELEADRLAKFLRRLTRRPRFFVVFREEADWRRSWLEQVRRSQILSEIINSGLPEDRCVTSDWYFDKSAIRNFWSKLGELVEISYDKHSDTRVALASKMGIDTRGLNFGPRLNVSSVL